MRGGEFALYSRNDKRWGDKGCKVLLVAHVTCASSSESIDSIPFGVALCCTCQLREYTTPFLSAFLLLLF